MREYHEYDLQGIATRYGLTEHPIFEIDNYFGDSDDYWIAGARCGPLC